MSFTVKIQGEKELIKKIDKLGKAVLPVLRKELRPAAKEEIQAVKPAVPKDTGMLRKSIKVKAVKKKKRYAVAFRVYADYPKGGPTKKNGKPKYWAFAPDYGVKNGKKGRGNQPGKHFFKKGQKAAEANADKTKARIAKGIEEVWKKGK